MGSVANEAYRLAMLSILRSLTLKLAEKGVLTEEEVADLQDRLEIPSTLEGHNEEAAAVLNSVIARIKAR
jgi:hypothetical protein